MCSILPRSLKARVLFAFVLAATGSASAAEKPQLAKINGASPRNIVFILVDDQRYDAMSCMGHPFLKTPGADSIAENGVMFTNAYVTTSLCSPSRASMLTGLYAHTHRVVDNSTPVSDKLVFFGEYLQQANYETAFVGKWHMGYGHSKPRRGWDHWVSFLGQGSYFPRSEDGKQHYLNVDGEKVPQQKYITDELTDYSVDWLRSRPGDGKPWMLYLSHKAVHHDFSPAPRHLGRFDSVKIPATPSTKGTKLDSLRPMWARNMRNSWHGAEFPFHGTLGKTEDIYRRYCEAMLSVDESTVRVLDYLKQSGQFDSTLVIYMGDNGHMWGEHDLIDKRTAYEESARVPLLMQCPEIVPAGTKCDEIAANIDIAPTLIEAGGMVPPVYMHGRSLLPLAEGEQVEDWRDVLLYEYFWERWAPSTPTIHALIGKRYKYIRPYGLWDLAELYDLQDDPNELENLAYSPKHKAKALEMDEQLFEVLRETEGHSIPLLRGWKGRAKELRDPTASEWAPVPAPLLSE
ncbi:sulfatase family protein [Stratiformator vulcanicus]|uniref:Arylsulfatase n=1 Tax=Stratiformator vulcanicus TaxID=2527980 RepID=A0A517R2X4_9PLAN|nr:sulfatase [Stratiformator vulcanicus]QDT38240.1 Arylsulfatase [Stratiformator vulcanicus]